MNIEEQLSKLNATKAQLALAFIQGLYAGVVATSRSEEPKERIYQRGRLLLARDRDLRLRRVADGSGVWTMLRRLLLRRILLHRRILLRAHLFKIRISLRL